VALCVRQDLTSWPSSR